MPYPKLLACLVIIIANSCLSACRSITGVITCWNIHCSGHNTLLEADDCLIDRLQKWVGLLPFHVSLYFSIPDSHSSSVAFLIHHVSLAAVPLHSACCPSPAKFQPPTHGMPSSLAVHPPESSFYLSI